MRIVCKMELTPIIRNGLLKLETILTKVTLILISSVIATAPRLVWLLRHLLLICVVSICNNLQQSATICNHYSNNSRITWNTKYYKISENGKLIRALNNSQRLREYNNFPNLNWPANWNTSDVHESQRLTGTRDATRCKTRNSKRLYACAETVVATEVGMSVQQNTLLIGWNTGSSRTIHCCNMLTVRGCWKGK